MRRSLSHTHAHAHAQTRARTQKGGGVLYFNDTLQLLWNPNLEHSRLGSYWSAYSALENAHAAEGFRCLAEAASRLQRPPAEAQLWTQLRAAALAGLDTSLAYTGPDADNTDPDDGQGVSIYAELRGHPNDFSEDKAQVGFSPLLWGMSWVNVAPLALGLSTASAAVLQRAATSATSAAAAAADAAAAAGAGSSAAAAAAAAAAADAVVEALVQSAGLNASRMDATFRAYRRRGGFQWVNADEARSALVPTTHTNASALWSPPPRQAGPAPAPAPPPAPTACAEPLTGAAALAVATGDDACNPRQGTDPRCANVTSAGECCAACAANPGARVRTVWLWLCLLPAAAARGSSGDFFVYCIK